MCARQSELTAVSTADAIDADEAEKSLDAWITRTQKFAQYSPLSSA